MILLIIQLFLGTNSFGMHPFCSFNDLWLTIVESEITIPKIIHYVWVGGAPKPIKVLQNIDSWKRYCNDWLIIEWNDTVLPSINVEYVRQAYNSKKWAFVADYLRLYALANYGGLYFDSDVELVHSIDSFLTHSFFMGYENYYGSINPGPHLIGSLPNHKLITGLLDQYPNLQFIQDDGQYNLTVLPLRFRMFFEQNYNLPMNWTGEVPFQIMDNCILYPWWYFCTPVSGKTTYAIHHFQGSWLKEQPKPFFQGIHGGKKTCKVVTIHLCFLGLHMILIRHRGRSHGGRSEENE